MSFQSVMGQEAALRRLKGLIASGRLPPALLFHGPAGVGKARAAVEFAKALNCSGGGSEKPCDSCDSCASADKGIDPDLKRVNAAAQAMLLGEEPEKQQAIKIETVRHFVNDLEMRSLAGRRKTAVVEEAHTMAASAANALLKALEEPPPRTLWILLTDHPDRLLPTILSRCHAVRFRNLPADVVESILARGGVAVPEAGRLAAPGAITRQAPRERNYALLAALSDGSPGQALEIEKNPLPDPDSWAADPLAPFRLAERLPRELHLARPLVESYLVQMMRQLRLQSGMEALSRLPVRRRLREIESLKRALRSNADPRLVLEFAAMEYASR